jgi:hypothetical protein
MNKQHGWANPRPDVPLSRVHYFRDGESLCKKWDVKRRVLSLTPTPTGALCSKCRQGKERLGE